MVSRSPRLIESHLVAGMPERGLPTGLPVVQALTQDATGTTLMLELEAALAGG